MELVGFGNLCCLIYLWNWLVPFTSDVLFWLWKSIFSNEQLWKSTFSNISIELVGNLYCLIYLWNWLVPFTSSVLFWFCTWNEYYFFKINRVSKFIVLHLYIIYWWYTQIIWKSVEIYILYIWMVYSNNMNNCANLYF